MRRESKYGTNKAVRFCEKCRQKLLLDYSSVELSMNKRNRWKLIDLLKEYSQSPDSVNKIIVRRNYNFYQYNGYQDELREKPPKHLSFACKPDFIYRPYVNYIKVNQHIFNLALRDGLDLLQSRINLQRLLDISSPDIPVALLYFLEGSTHCYSSDWFNAWRHAFGGYLADYSMLCSGDYCPFGPKIRGQQTAGSRINQVLFFSTQTHPQGRWGCCSNGSWRRPTRSDHYEYKQGRSRVKTQRREKNILTKQALIVKTSSELITFSL